MGRRLASLAVLALLAGCDGLTSSPTAPSQAGPVSLIGTYAAADFWSASVLSGVLTLYSRRCPGSLVVESQSGTDWQGRFTSQAPCPAESGPVHGTVDGAGRVTLQFDGVSIAGTPYSAGPCNELSLGISGAPELRGQIDQGGIDLSIETTAKCLDPEVTAKLRLEAKGPRQP